MEKSLYVYIEQYNFAVNDISVIMKIINALSTEKIRHAFPRTSLYTGRVIAGSL